MQHVGRAVAVLPERGLRQPRLRRRGDGDGAEGQQWSEQRQRQGQCEGQEEAGPGEAEPGRDVWQQGWLHTGSLMTLIRCIEPMVGTDLISLLLNCLADPDWILAYQDRHNLHGSFSGPEAKI